jgi:hypothetical protein
MPIPQGVLDGPGSIHQDGINLVIGKGDATVRSFDLTYPVDSSSGWHMHPGIVIAVVVSGTVSRQLKDCSIATFSAGEAFTEVGPHLVWNPGMAEAVLRITQVFPTGEAPRTNTDPYC